MGRLRTGVPVMSTARLDAWTRECTNLVRLASGFFNAWLSSGGHREKQAKVVTIVMNKQDIDAAELTHLHYPMAHI